MNKSKHLKAAYEAIGTETSYPTAEALKLMLKHNKVKFDATAEIHFTLGIDPRHADQQIRSTISLPNGTGKTVRVVAVCGDDKVKEAKAAGAMEAGGEDLVEKMAKGWTDFDSLVATPDMMRVLAKAARTLGPKGLMPNPKTGTVTPEIEKVIKELVGGRIEFRNDKHGIVHTVFGKISFGEDKLMTNLEAIIKALQDAKPSGQKGIYIKKLTINSTMGPGIKIDLSTGEEQ
jgi:large subunit ribosomal protein L1